MHFYCIRFILCLFVCFASSDSLAQPSQKPFIDKYCADCHNATQAEAKLDLTVGSWSELSAQNQDLWIVVHDRINRHEMPPSDSLMPSKSERSDFLNGLSTSSSRRMNRFEFENTLRELLCLPDLHVHEFLPVDGEAFGFNKVGQALDVSHVQIARIARQFV